MKLALVILLALGPLAVLSKEPRRICHGGCVLRCKFERAQIIVNDKIEFEVPSARQCLDIQDKSKCHRAHRLEACLKQFLSQSEWETLVKRLEF